MRYELVALLETVLGPSSPRRQDNEKDNIAFNCPNPACSSHGSNKKKLEVNLKSKFWHCWVCHSRGSKLSTLLRFSGKSTTAHYQELKRVGEFVDLSRDIILEHTDKKRHVELPPEAFPVLSKRNSQTEAAVSYLIKRDFTKTDILRYRIHFAASGNHEDRIIIPTYGRTGLLMDYSSRTIHDDMYPKYLEPIFDKSQVIGFESLINWKLPVTLVEGKLDAIAVRHNAIPLSGTYMMQRLFTVLLEHKPTVTICLDPEAKEYGIKLAKKLHSSGISVFFAELPNNEDPASLGHELVWEYIRKALPVNFEFFMKHKIESI